MTQAALVIRPLFLFLMLLSACAAAPPNVIVILVDDLGYGDLRSHGATDLQSPHIDSLMSRGMRFDQFYANCTVCSPTRASLMTGRYPDLVGVPGVIRQDPKGNWGYFRPTGPTLPTLLKQAGYHTALIGKWHLGLKSPNTPNEHGFDHFHGFLGDMMDDYYSHTRGGVNWMRRNQETIKAEGHATEVFTRWTIEYLEQRSSQKSPFFLYLAYNAPHFPIQPPKEWLQKVKDRNPDLDPKRAANVALVEHLDHEIGKVIAKLDQLGLTKDTLIVFSSDNGGSLPHAQSNGDLRGGKQDHWEGGIRVPTCVVWPDHIPAGRINHTQGMTMDLLPTLCEIAGVSISHEIDGISLASTWLKDESRPADRTMIWTRREGGAYQGRAYYAIRKGNTKLLQNSPFETMKMVDLQLDPREESPTHPTGPLANRLNQALTEHIRKSGSTPWQTR